MTESVDIEVQGLEDLLGVVKAQIISELSYSSMSMDDLSKFLEINKNAVQEHMHTLEIKGYVRPFFQRGPHGRPKKFFELTEKGMDLFPKKYVALANMLINEIKDDFGDDALNKVLAGVAERLVKTYGISPISGESDNEPKIRQLRSFVDALNRMGYSAKLEVDGDLIKIVRYNCIFYDIARNNSGAVCGSLGEQIVKGALGENFSIKEKFSTGSRKCVVELKI